MRARRLRPALAAVAVAALFGGGRSSATPSGTATVSAGVTPAAPCIEIGAGVIDFGALRLQQTVTRQASATAVIGNCTGRPLSLLIRGTDLLGSGGTVWRLSDAPGSVCTLGPARYKAVVGLVSPGNTVQLSTANKAFPVPMDVGVIGAATYTVNTPCNGSPGSGQRYGGAVVFTATSAP